MASICSPLTSVRYRGNPGKFEEHSTWCLVLGDTGLMSVHSVTEATVELPRLIDRALKGESVVIVSERISPDLAASRSI